MQKNDIQFDFCTADIKLTENINEQFWLLDWSTEGDYFENHTHCTQVLNYHFYTHTHTRTHTHTHIAAASTHVLWCFEKNHCLCT